MKFAEDYGFEQATSSPGFPHSNGGTERAVQIANNLLRQYDYIPGSDDTLNNTNSSDWEKVRLKT